MAIWTLIFNLPLNLLRLLLMFQLRAILILRNSLMEIKEERFLKRNSLNQVTKITKMNEIIYVVMSLTIYLLFDQK